MNSIHNVVELLETSLKPTLRCIGHKVLVSQAFVGDYKVSARTDDDLGWLLCDGRLLDRDEYADLFDVIGTAFGTTTAANFRLPDLRGRVLGAVGAGTNLSSRALGDAVGAERHTLSTSELPAHSHGGSTASDGAHTHTHNANGGAVGLAFKNNLNTTTGTDNSGDEINLSATAQLNIASGGAHAHAISSEGGGAAHNNMQPTLFAGNVFIFAGLECGGCCAHAPNPFGGTI